MSKLIEEFNNSLQRHKEECLRAGKLVDVEEDFFLTEEKVMMIYEKLLEEEKKTKDASGDLKEQLPPKLKKRRKIVQRFNTSSAQPIGQELRVLRSLPVHSGASNDLHPNHRKV